MTGCEGGEVRKDHKGEMKKEEAEVLRIEKSV